MISIESNYNTTNDPIMITNAVTKLNNQDKLNRLIG